MTPSIISLNPKPVPQNTPRQLKPPASTPTILDKTAFPKKAPVGTRPSKREPGHGELGRRRRSGRRTSRSTKPESRPQSKSLEVPPASRLRTPGASAELERRFRNLELRQKNLVEQSRKGGELEYLAVAENGAGQFWITVVGTGKPFVRKSFATPGFCWEVALEIEENFEIDQVIELRPGETMERIGEMGQAGLERERVAECWAEKGLLECGQELI